MTQLYEFGFTKTTAAAAGPIATFVASAAARPDIREIGIFVSSAVAAQVGIGRPAANGAGAITGSPTTTAVALDPGDPAAACQVATSFATTQPTAPATPFSRLSLPAVVGAGFVWTFGINELAVPASGNLVIWQFSAVAVTFDGYVKWEE